MTKIDNFNPQEYKIISTINKTNFSIDYLIENKESANRYDAKVILINSNIPTNSEKRFISSEIEHLMNFHHLTINNYIAYSFSDFDNKKNMTILTKYLKYDPLSMLIDQQSQGNCSKKYNNTKRQIILIGICFGMMLLHKNHILHRSLKPENIYIDDNFQPIISNYGLTTIFDPQNSKSLSDYKNFIYLAPETLKSNQYSEKSDIYSFGMLMYEIIYGIRCYSNIIINEKHFSQERLKSKIIKGLRPKFIGPIKKGFQQIIERCWSENLFDRPTFSELYDAFTGKDESSDASDENNYNYILDNVSEIEMMKYIEKIQNENNENSMKSDNYLSQINSLKTEIESMKETIINQNNEIKNLKKIIVNQSDQMNSKIIQEHCEVQNMREYILNQIRKEFIIYKKHSYPTKLLSNIDKIFIDHNVIKLFSKFCLNRMSIEYYYYIEDMNAYYEMKDDLKSLLFYDFRDKYFIEGAPYFLNIQTSVIREICDSINPSPELLEKALDLVNVFLRVELVRKFKHSPQYNEYFLSIKRRRKPKKHVKRRKA